MPRSTAVNFQSEVPAGGSLELQHQVEREGVVTRIFVVAVPNEQADVERYMELVKSNGSNRINLIESATDGSDEAEEYLAGDDYVWDIPVDEEFSAEDRVQMRVVNNDGRNPYPNIAYAVIRYDGVDAALGYLRGLL